MLDKISIAILKVLNKLTESSSYKVVTGDEILLNLNRKNQCDLDSIKDTMQFLEKQEYINIKFFEENTYCYSLTPKARIYLEQEVNKPTQSKNQLNIMAYVYMMIASFIGSLLAILIFFYATF